MAQADDECFFTGGWMSVFHDCTFGFEAVKITKELRAYLSGDGMVLGPVRAR